MHNSQIACVLGFCDVLGINFELYSVGIYYCMEPNSISGLNASMDGLDSLELVMFAPKFGLEFC